MRGAPISYHAEQQEVSWQSDPLKCSICFSELTTTFLRTSCDHVLCKVHKRDPSNDLPHSCPACKKSLASDGLVEQEPSCFQSEADLRDFAKRLRPEEGFKLSLFSAQFHVKQKQIETLIEARKFKRSSKTEARLREYTKQLADEINEIRPQYTRLEAELASAHEQMHMYRAAKEEAEAKLAQVNARLGSAPRRVPLELTQGGTSPGTQWRPDVHGSGGGAGEYGYRSGTRGAGHEAPRPYASHYDQQQRSAPSDYYGASLNPRAHPLGVGEAPPHVNKRLKPGFDASPRAWGKPPLSGTPDELARGGAPHASAAPMSVHGLLNPNATPMASPVYPARALSGGIAQGDATLGRMQRGPPGSPMSALLTGRPHGLGASTTGGRSGGSLYADRK